MLVAGALALRSRGPGAALAAGGTIVGVPGSTLKMRKRRTPSAIFRLWSSVSSSSLGASKRNQR